MSCWVLCWCADSPCLKAHTLQVCLLLLPWLKQQCSITAPAAALRSQAAAVTAAERHAGSALFSLVSGGPQLCPRELRTVEKGVCAGNLHLHSQDTFPVPIPCLILVLGCITEEQGLWLQGCRTLSVVHGQVCLVCLWLLTASDSTAPSAAA